MEFIVLPQRVREFGIRGKDTIPESSTVDTAPVPAKLREWFSSFTGIPWSLGRPRRKWLPKSPVESTNCFFVRGSRGGVGETILFDP